MTERSMVTSQTTKYHFRLTLTNTYVGKLCNACSRKLNIGDRVLMQDGKIQHHDCDNPHK